VRYTRKTGRWIIARKFGTKLGFSAIHFCEFQYLSQSTNNTLMKKENKKTKTSKRIKSSIGGQARIPRGFGTVTPYLIINRAAEAIDFYKTAFGAKKLGVETLPDGKILHERAANDVR
jgi:hypothetical protein